MYLLRIRIVEAPSEKCAKCNWWLLLGEIREEFEMALLTNRGMEVVKRNHRGIVSNLFSQSAHKVCKEHWEGKR